MPKLLLISDDPRRTGRLMQDLGGSRSSSIYDLYGGGPTSGQPDLIVSDVKVLNTEAFQQLRHVLEQIRGTSVPYVCLLHDNGVRTLNHAKLLGASALLSASSAVGEIIDTISELQFQMAALPASAVRQADTALRFLSDVFRPGHPITPDLVDVGTNIVAEAVRDNGIRTWIQIVQRFDDATHQHSLLVAGLASSFATTLGLSTADRHHLAKAALLHDIGKVQVPAHILNKPDKLTADETSVMRTHAEKGHAMLLWQGFDESLLAVVRSHHEMLDGSGYPDKLMGSYIPDLVRLVTICDVYGALIERRPYRSPMSSQEAYAILVKMKGRIDPDLVEAFHHVENAFGQRGSNALLETASKAKSFVRQSGSQ
ncbi:HD domain-containing phosphohydrolase [Methylobacterium sp. Leaf86]|uniref:HD-GYP domain-containing protein n=1 Tax=Methylobacterium sp. Leaf86 TaxID=1736242 RepID=UPI0009E99B03|nr:HD domain-containing phosphohydrolase [Methylobacterium sp. Leaf86]